MSDNIQRIHHKVMMDTLVQAKDDLLEMLEDERDPEYRKLLYDLETALLKMISYHRKRIDP